MRYLALSLLILLGAGCTPSPSMPPVPPPHDMPVPHDTSDHASAQEMPDEPSDEDRVVFQKTPTGQKDDEIVFVLLDAAGQPLDADRLAIAHEKKLHLILVRENYKEYYHLHPDFIDGAWRVKANPLGGADYGVYLDFVPVGGEPEVLRTSFRVGTRHATEMITPAQDQTVDGDVTAAFEREGDTYRFALRQNGAPPKDLRTYLGAYGHVVVLSHADRDVYVHAHPMTETKPTDGRITFMGALPAPGRYTAFAQFNVAGTIRTFTYTFDVQAVSPATHMQH